MQPLVELVNGDMLAVAVHGGERGGIDDHRHKSVGDDTPFSELLRVGSIRNHGGITVASGCSFTMALLSVR